MAVRVVGWAEEEVSGWGEGESRDSEPGSVKASGKRGCDSLLSASLSQVWSTVGEEEGSMGSGCTGEPGRSSSVEGVSSCT